MSKIYRSMDRIPIGTLLEFTSDGAVRVLGYERPPNADQMTIPPWSGTELKIIEAGVE